MDERNKLDVKGVVNRHITRVRIQGCLPHASVARHSMPCHAAYREYADSVLWRYDILSCSFATTFLITFCTLLGSDLCC